MILSSFCVQHISRTEHWTVNKRDSCKVMNIPGSLLYTNTMWREYGNQTELQQYSFYAEFYMFLRTQAISNSIRSFVLYHLMYYKAALANSRGGGEVQISEQSRK